MSKLSEKVSTILDMSVPEGKWQSIALLLDRTGRPNSFEMRKILFTLCEAVEEIQQNNVQLLDINFQKEAPKSDETAPTRAK